MGQTILDIIGNTPMVEITRLNPNPKVRMLAKLEYTNPGGSVKDRPALYMIEAAEKSGQLTPDKTVIEATSGNTGIGLAMICSVKGYRLLLAMSEAVSVERRKILKARGAEILLTPGHLGTDGAIEEVYRLARQHPESYFVVDQFNNEANWKAHYHGTAEEIWRQTEGQVTMVVTALGTTGTAMGVSRRLKEYNPAVQIVAVEPYLGHKIQGLKNMKEAYCPEIFDKRRVDKKVNVEDEEAYEAARRLAREEGLLVGMSSGAAMAVARREAQKMDGGVIVVILPDGGERYLSTPLFAVQEKLELAVFNALGRRKEAFIPAQPETVGIYTCGPTAHGPLHLGELRRFVFADLVHSYLEFRGLKVNHVVDINDLDDKTIQGAESAATGLDAFVRDNISRFQDDLKALAVTPHDHYPRASEHIDAMVQLAEKLVEKGYAYERLRSLYFDLGRLSGYGGLSGIDVDKVRIGATVDLEAYDKQNPRDFAIFKRCRLSDLKRGVFTQTRWGNVRPTWHIKSAAMAMTYLGVPFDLHISSRELIFPHHENENAIAAAAEGKPLANYWMMCDRVMKDGKKMDLSNEDLCLGALMAAGFSGREVRFWLLSTHYRKPLVFSQQRLDEARRSLRRLDRCIQALQLVGEGQTSADVDQIVYDLRYGFTAAMDDDLNISQALAAVFKVVKRINASLAEEAVGRAGAAALLDAFGAVDAVLRVISFDVVSSDPRTQELLHAREEARRLRDWAVADRLRTELESEGVTVKDRKL